MLQALRRKTAGWAAALALAPLLAPLALSGCATAPADGARLDATPRVAVVSAFQPELALLLGQVQGARQYRVNGVEFTTGTLQGKNVVLFLSGISMTNAAMNTQLALDRFKVSHIVFSGIAGGVNPALHIGDVTDMDHDGAYRIQGAATESGENTPTVIAGGTISPGTMAIE